MQSRASLLDRLRPTGAPGLSRLRVEPAIAALHAGEGILLSEVLAAASAETAARIALRSQLLNELMQRNANLLCHGIVNVELLRNLSEQRNEVLRMVRRLLTGNRAQQWVVLQIRADAERAMPERIRRERILREYISLSAKAKRILRGEARLPEFLTEQHVTAIHAGLPKQTLTHLRPSGSLRRHQALRGILRKV
jgi:hypothetical protein